MSEHKHTSTVACSCSLIVRTMQFCLSGNLHISRRQTMTTTWPLFYFLFEPQWEINNINIKKKKKHIRTLTTTRSLSLTKRQRWINRRQYFCTLAVKVRFCMYACQKGRMVDRTAHPRNSRCSTRAKFSLIQYLMDNNNIESRRKAQIEFDGDGDGDGVL